MTPHERIRRVALLCVHAISNFASYRAGRTSNPPRKAEPFWVRANGNFYDVGLLEWCKLFADPRGAHFVDKVLTDPAGFKGQLLSHLKISEADLESYCKDVRAYRDKFVAHLDSDLRARLPKLDIAIESSKFLLDYLHANEEKGTTFVGIPRGASRLYRGIMADAKKHYAARAAQQTHAARREA
jgi:hypothetical protein